MKRIEHTVFVDTAVYPRWTWFTPIWAGNPNTRHARNRERVRRRAEDFINEIGVDHVLSVAEHSAGPFSVVVWWFREFAETDPLVLRPSPSPSPESPAA